MHAPFRDPRVLPLRRAWSHRRLWVRSSTTPDRGWAHRWYGPEPGLLRRVRAHSGAPAPVRSSRVPRGDDRTAGSPRDVYSPRRERLPPRGHARRNSRPHSRTVKLHNSLARAGRTPACGIGGPIVAGRYCNIPATHARNEQAHFARAPILGFRSQGGTRSPCNLRRPADYARNLRPH